MSYRRPGPRDRTMDKAAMAREDARYAIALRAIGADIRQHREAAGISLERAGEQIGWAKDSMSKMERGMLRISLVDYLYLMRILKDTDPTHPAMALADRLLPRVQARIPGAAD